MKKSHLRTDLLNKRIYCSYAEYKLQVQGFDDSFGVSFNILAIQVCLQFDLPETAPALLFISGLNNSPTISHGMGPYPTENAKMNMPRHVTGRKSRFSSVPGLWSLIQKYVPNGQEGYLSFNLTAYS